VLARSGQDHPVWVSAPTDFFVRLIAGHPAPLNVGFALVQLALGVGFLVPPSGPARDRGVRGVGGWDLVVRRPRHRDCLRGHRRARCRAPVWGACARGVAGY
jgi:hypothetical protein